MFKYFHMQNLRIGYKWVGTLESKSVENGECNLIIFLESIYFYQFYGQVCF